MGKRKKLSNPFSTGGRGQHFEACVQASFVTLMLTGGHAPCLPCWPIVEIKLQGKIDGFDTDDLIVVVENPDNKKQKKLLGNIKQSIEITKSSKLFNSVMQAAWDDINKPENFTKNNDIIALITGPLNKTDNEIIWLANHARANDADTFFRNVAKTNFSSDIKREKLKVFRHHLRIANSGIDVQDDELHIFLKHFYLLGYDLGEEEGVILSLINSHISQFGHQRPREIWSRILEFTGNRNHHAGVITSSNIPEELVDLFQKPVIRFSQSFFPSRKVDSIELTKLTNAYHLALAVLAGAWDENNKNDIDVIAKLFGITYDEWLQKAREIVQYPDSPLSIKNGIWKVNNRTELWDLLGSLILDQNLDTFKSIVVAVLKESDPALELPSEERYAASIYGKVLKHSRVLRKGLAEGLAILCSQPKVCSNCSLGKSEATGTLVVHEIFVNADWSIWGSLNEILPILAEAAPKEFLNLIEKTLSLTPCIFDELFAQESGGITGRSYLTGLLWALEGIAWDENYFVRACIALGDIANRDPGGKWANRPSNSLVTILLPWLPQTLASINKRRVAVKTLLKEQPDVGWGIVLQLMHEQHQTSHGSYKPSWRKIIPDNWIKGVTNQEYWQQVSCYAELAVKFAGNDARKLVELIDRFNYLSRPAFDQLVEILTSRSISELPEEQRHSLWEHLIRFASKHRRFVDAEWALSDELVTRIENIANQLAPTNLFYLYQHLFSDNSFDLYDENGSCEEQQKKLDARRETAIKTIFQHNGIEGVISFSETVTSPGSIGYALGAIDDDIVEQKLLPSFLNTVNNTQKTLVSGFIWKRHSIKGWEWCDAIDKSRWTSEQTGRFLTCLPFTQSTWDRVSLWLDENQNKYWFRVGVNIYYQEEEDFNIVIEKLIEYGRSCSAVNCLGMMLHAKKTIKIEQCVRALLTAISCKESSDIMDTYRIVDLIKFLQSEPSVSMEDLFKVEWSYLPLLNQYSNATPRILENRLANNPEFFCEAIQLVYRSNKEEQVTKENYEGSIDVAVNAQRLLREWKTPPGTGDSGTFNAEHFNEWLERVKTLCTESGHLEVAMLHIGEVLIHAPSDPSGLWIHHEILAALNDRDADDMRAGFRTGTYNSRGAHIIDPSGTPEIKLAEQFNGKAEDVENAGFHRFAITLKDLASNYEQEAEWIQHKES